MRISLSRNLALAFAGAVGLAGSAAAHPGDHVSPQVREGTPPAHIMKADISLRAAHDGRGETNAGDYNPVQRDSAFNTPSAKSPDRSLDSPRPFALPIKADIKNRVTMRDDGDDPKSSNDTLASRSSVGGHKDAGPSTYAAPSRSAPIAIKTDIALKIEAGEDSQINTAARPNDQRAKHKGSDVTASQRSKIHDASQADLRDPRKYPGAHENLPTPAQMFSKVALHNGSDSSGDASSEPTP